ncbi:MAG: DUF4160 domain-containing protein [Planctomycetes bacterium]|nr:DUF4160 domain-containing protein [Planctomycetota bacterium]
MCSITRRGLESHGPRRRPAAWLPSAAGWIDPDVSLADNHGFSRKELRDIERIVRDNLEMLRDEWDAFCTGDSDAQDH